MKRGWHKRKKKRKNTRNVWKHCWIIYKVIIAYFKKNCNSKLPWVKVKWKESIYSPRSENSNRMSPKNKWKAFFFYLQTLFSALFFFFFISRVFTILCWMHYHESYCDKTLHFNCSWILTVCLKERTKYISSSFFEW